MRKWQHVALTAALTVATAGGVAFAGVAANAKPAIPHSAGQPAAASFHGRGSVAANIRVVETFLQDVLDGHHGDHAANYLTKDAQFHAGTVGNFTGRATVAGVLAGIVAAIPDLHANVQDIFGHGDEVVVRLVVTGTQEGPLLGISRHRASPPVGRDRSLPAQGRQDQPGMGVRGPHRDPQRHGYVQGTLDPLIP